MLFSLIDTVLLFFIYSFVGWCVEVAFVAVTVGKVENRGFLNGPICPIYGVGMLGVLMALLPFKEQWVIVFFGGMLICSAVELFGGWVLDKIFHMRWWDYTDKPFNIGGYICLGFSIMWGMAVVFAVRFIHPLIMKVVDKLPQFVCIIVICVFAAMFIADMIVTLKNLIGIRRNLGQLEKLAEDLNNIGNQLKDVVGNSAINVATKTNDNLEDVKERLENIGDDAKERLNMLGENTKERLENISDDAKERLNALGENTKERLERINEKSRIHILKKEELEERRAEIIKKLHNNTKYRLNKLPTLHKSGRSINIKEYLESLKNDKDSSNDE